MATIEMSPAFATGYTTRMISLQTGTTHLQSLPEGYSAFGAAASNGLFSYAYTNSSAYYMTQSYLHLMKGTKPADFSGLTKYEDRSADILATFTVSASHFSMVQAENLATMSTIYVNAITSGSATWFWLITRSWNMYSGFYPNSALIHQTMGTVGLPGTSSDLELQDTNLVAGQPYRVLNLGLRFPTSWTF